jgi:hypothetical protein
MQMHKLSFIIGVMGLCVVTQAALQPVRLICKSIDRSERFRSRWVAVGLIAGLMALAIGSSAAVALPRSSCYSDFVATSNACGNDVNCTINASAVYYQCQYPVAGDGPSGSKGKDGTGGSKTKSGPRGSKRDVPVHASAPKTNPGVLNPNVGGTSTAHRPPVAQPTTSGGLENATNPAAGAGPSTGATLTTTGQGVGSVVGGTVPPRATISPTGDIFGTTRTGPGIGSLAGGTNSRPHR